MTYLFIDGAYLRSRLKYISKRFSLDPLDLDYEALRRNIAQKAFYYDCLPAKGRSEKRDDYDRRVQPMQNSLKAVRSLPGYHVVLGEAVHSGGEIVQKGVDIRIAVDMLTHSFRGVIDRATLFAGDRDFVPLVSALVQHGIYVTVGYHPQSVAEELLDAADKRAEYDTVTLWGLATPQFKRRFPAPLRDFMAPPNFDKIISFDALIQSGTYKMELVKLYRSSSFRANSYLLCISSNDYYGSERYEVITHPDREVIMKLLDERDIVVTWD